MVIYENNIELDRNQNFESVAIGFLSIRRISDFWKTVGFRRIRMRHIPSQSHVNINDQCHHWVFFSDFTGSGVADVTEVEGPIHIEMSSMRWQMWSDALLKSVDGYVFHASSTTPSNSNLHINTDKYNSTFISIWRPLLPYGYSYKASCARPR